MRIEKILLKLHFKYARDKCIEQDILFGLEDVINFSGGSGFNFWNRKILDSLGKLCCSIFESTIADYNLVCLTCIELVHQVSRHLNRIIKVQIFKKKNIISDDFTVFIVLSEEIIPAFTNTNDC